MKLDELKKIIKEELKSILEANAPEKEEKKTKEYESHIQKIQCITAKILYG